MEAELNPAQRLHTLGQCLWLDSINRVMLRTGRWPGTCATWRLPG